MKFGITDIVERLVLFVDNLFFYSGGQSVSCKASLAALRLYGFL